MAIEHPNQSPPEPPQQATPLDKMLEQDQREDTPPPGAGLAAREMTKRELAEWHASGFRRAVEHMVAHGVMQRWEADHLFGPIFAHLRGI